MIKVTITRSGADWSREVPIGFDISEEEYSAFASKTIFVRDGYILDLSQETSVGFAYDEIVGRTIGEIRNLFPAENDSEFKSVTVYTQGDGDFYIPGSVSWEDVIAGPGNDVLTDGGGPAGEGWSDYLFGGAGDDTYFVNSSDSETVEFAIVDGVPDPSRDAGGHDVVITTAPFYLRDGSAIETIIMDGAYSARGNNLANTIVGDFETNLMFGREGTDRLIGNGGDDTLRGGEGSDRLVGGEGSDLYLFVGESTGRDVISSFSDEDVLVTSVRIRDNNGDGIIQFGSDRRLDFSRNTSVVMSDDEGRTITNLEYDGSYVSEGVTYYVYSLVGSAAGVATAEAHELTLD